MDAYYKAASEHCERWQVNDPHVIRICQSVMMDRDGIVPGGGFVQSVNRNDLRAAVSTADRTCMTNLKVIVLSKHHAYVDEKYMVGNFGMDI